MPYVKAVLLDWVGTLIVPKWGPDGGAHWIGGTLRRLGRDASAAQVRRVADALAEAVRLPEVVRARHRADVSAEHHRAAYDHWVAAAGLDPELAEQLYAALSDPVDNRVATDAVRTLAALGRAGVKVAIVSDIHVDLRPGLVHHGLDAYVDHYFLSYAHGLCKPDPAFFRLALERLGVRPGEALMVGDRSAYDGGAVEAGIPTLLVPPLTDPAEERLHLVLGACGVPA